MAREHAGANVNQLTNDALLDAPSANVALDGVPVSLERVEQARG